MNIPDRLLVEAFWELENNLNSEVFADCSDITSNSNQARELYINFRAMHFMLLEKNQKKNDAAQLIRTEEIWDQMKKESRENGPI
mgnify:CR=1 FL=1